MRNLLLYSLLILITVVAAACGGDDDDSGDSGNDGDPAAVAQEYLEAAIGLDVDRVRELTCEAEQATIDPDDVPEEEVSFDFSGVEFTAEIDGDEAIVTGSGPVSVTFDGQTEEGDFENLGLGALRMVREDGDWKACGTPEDALDAGDELQEDGAATPEPDDTIDEDE